MKDARPAPRSVRTPGRLSPVLYAPQPPGRPMTRAPGLLAPLLGLGLELGLILSPPGAAASDCGSFGRAEHLTFAPASRARWLTPRVRPPGPLNPLYGTVRRFLSVVQLNPFPAGE